MFIHVPKHRRRKGLAAGPTMNSMRRVHWFFVIFFAVAFFVTQVGRLGPGATVFYIILGVGFLFLLRAVWGSIFRNIYEEGRDAGRKEH